MTFSGNTGSGQHFRGRYSPATPQPAPAPQESPPPEYSVAQPAPAVCPQPLPEPPPRSTGQSPTPAALLAVGLLAGMVAIVDVLVTKQSSTPTPLSWQSSCGSAPVSGSRWWPVLGPAEAVDTIRSRFCGDAFVTEYGYAQVASFSSFEEATAFAQRLSGASGYSFRVGEPRTP
jgi:hypothetical protein